MSEPASKWKRLVPIAATAIALVAWWSVAGDSLPEVGRALGRISGRGFALAVALSFLNFTIAASRFRTLLRAYGGNEHVPSLRRALGLYLVAHFYNVALPGNLAGDVLRAHLTRKALPSAGSYIVVVVERVFGLTALFLITSGIALVHGLATTPALMGLTVLGVCIAASGAAFPFVARAAGRRIGGRVQALTSELPVVQSRRGLAVALAESLGTQLTGALAGFAVLDGLAPSVGMLDALALLPLATLAAYFPTLAGLGARELAFVALLAPLGVGEAEATAASLGLLATQLVPAAVGALLHVLGRDTPS